jgi:hypothetical protein
MGDGSVNGVGWKSLWSDRKVQLGLIGLVATGAALGAWVGNGMWGAVKGTGLSLLAATLVLVNPEKVAVLFRYVADSLGGKKSKEESRRESTETRDRPMPEPEQSPFRQARRTTETELVVDADFVDLEDRTPPSSPPPRFAPLLTLTKVKDPDDDVRRSREFCELVLMTVNEVGHFMREHGLTLLGITNNAVILTRNLLALRLGGSLPPGYGGREYGGRSSMESHHGATFNIFNFFTRNQ